MYTLIATGIGLLVGSYVHYPNLFDKPLTLLMPILMITLIIGLVNEVYKKRVHCK